MHNTTASAITAGVVLHRVTPAPLSAVFTAAIDALVLDVYPTPDFETTHVTVVLDPQGARRHVVNLALDRAVTVV